MNYLWTDLEQTGTLTDPLRAAVVEQYRNRGARALEALDEERVQKYLDFWVVVGTRDEYIVDEDFCTCNDFIYRGGSCCHILAVRIAQLTGIFQEYARWYLDERPFCTNNQQYL